MRVTKKYILKLLKLIMAIMKYTMCNGELFTTLVYHNSPKFVNIIMLSVSRFREILIADLHQKVNSII